MGQGSVVLVDCINTSSIPVFLPGNLGGGASLILHTDCFPGCCRADQSRRPQIWSICFDFPEFAGLGVAASVALRGVCCLSNSSCVGREPRGGGKGSVVYRLTPTHPLFVCVSPSLCLTPCFPSEKKLFSVLVKGNTKQGCL